MQQNRAPQIKRRKSADSTQAALRPLRAQPKIAIAFAADENENRTVVGRLAESGGARVLLPRRLTSTKECQALIVNTAGGYASGDRAHVEIEVGPRSQALVSTPAAERVYRSDGPTGVTSYITKVICGAGSELLLVPQETILFAGSRLHRSLEADVDKTARLIVVEITTFGRQAMGEAAGHGELRQDWTVRQDGRLSYAERLRIDGDLGTVLAKKEVADGHRVMGTLLFLGREVQDCLDGLRSRLEDWQKRLVAAASCWEGKLVLRLLAHGTEQARAVMLEAIEYLGGSSLARLWGY